MQGCWLYDVFCVLRSHFVQPIFILFAASQWSQQQQAFHANMLEHHPIRCWEAPLLHFKLHVTVKTVHFTSGARRSLEREKYTWRRRAGLVLDVHRWIYSCTGRAPSGEDPIWCRSTCGTRSWTRRGSASSTSSESTTVLLLYCYCFIRINSTRGHTKGLERLVYYLLVV